MSPLLQSLVATSNNNALIVLRVVLAVVLFPHGAQKLLGWFGGYGFAPTMQYFTQGVHLPWIIGFFVILIEFFAPIFLITGFATRPVALSVIILMIGAALTVCLQNGFFMNWTGTQKGEGIEFHLLVIGMALPLMLEGAGSYSLDKVLSSQLTSKKLPI